MFMFGGWDYGSVLAMVDSLVYDRRYGGFYEIIENLTIKELLEIFRVVHNKEVEKELKKAQMQKPNDIPVNDISQEMLDFLNET